MEVLDHSVEEEMESDGSGSAVVFFNTSLNATSNVTNITYMPYYQHSLFVAVSYLLAYFFIFLFCMVGNILVCVIILENRRMRTVTNLFILNLAISDLLVGIFCIPTTLVDNLITGWPFSNIVCKMSGFVQGTSVSASVFTLVAIAVERFRCIVYPLRPRLTLLVAKATTVLIWVSAVAIMCPAATALSVEEVPHHYMVYNFNQTYPLYSCYENFANPQMRKVYTAVLFTHIYLAPLAVITLMYGSIGVKLYTSGVANQEQQIPNGMVQLRGRRGVISKKKLTVIKMLILVALLFMLSWLPLWTLMMMTDYAGLDRYQLNLLTSYIFPFAHWLAFSNSSINPIIYGYYNENFKRGFRAVCTSQPFCCLVRCQLWRRARGSRQGRPVQAPCAGNDLRCATSNRNPIVFGTRNQVHNDNNLTNSAELNRRAQVGCVAAHSNNSVPDLEMAVVNKNGTNSEESQRVSSQAASVYQAWDN
ncbi:neuropeptide FF receptor 1 like 2 [Genypterus blacodes]|uniref:neuropeptide FF receptor 1 like 2 n=1 Tax=Genypterus blacodes TaxID=154954 RepID=UPI003F77199A